MKISVVSVLDVAIGRYAQPAFVPSVGAAVRSFGDQVGRVDPQNAMNAHPQDFQLYELGTFDEDTGRFENLDKPRRVAAGADFVTIS